MSWSSSRRKKKKMKDLTRKLEEYCDFASPSPNFSEAGLRELIERHGFLPNTDFDYNAHMLVGDDFFHKACLNERVSEGVLRCLLEYFPDAANTTNTSDGETPLHCLCQNKNVTLGMVKLLIDAAPESVKTGDYFDKTPLHCLCCNETDLDVKVAVDILRLLVMKYPEATRHYHDIDDWDLQNFAVY
jgi:ankyrin repeat protein